MRGFTNVLCDTAAFERTVNLVGAVLAVNTARTVRLAGFFANFVTAAGLWFNTLRVFVVFVFGVGFAWTLRRLVDATGGLAKGALAGSWDGVVDTFLAAAIEQYTRKK